MLAVLYAAFFFEKLQRPLYGAGLGLLAGISILSYAGSVLTLGIFVPFLCLAVFVSREGRPSFQNRRLPRRLAFGRCARGRVALLLAVHPGAPGRLPRE